MAFRAAGAVWSLNTSGSTVALATPAGAASGDRLIAVLNCDTSTTSVSPPSGWVLVASVVQLVDSQKSVVYELQLSGAPASTYTFTCSGGAGGGKARMYAFSGRGAGASIISGSGVFNTTGTNDPSVISAVATTLTAVAGDDLLHITVCDQGADDTWTTAAPSGFTDRGGASGTDGGGGSDYSSLFVHSQDSVSAGATGSKTATLTSSGASTGWASILVSIPAGAGGGTSVTPGVGALTLATFAPTLAQPHGVAPGAAALTLATFSPAVTQPIGVAPSAAALVLATFAPSITQPHGVSPGVSALTLATFAPTVAQAATGTNVTPDVGALALATFAPTLAQTANQALTPSVGALTLTGFAPTISQPQTASPGVLALSLATFAPSISQPHDVSPGVSALVLTGYAPSVVVGAPSQNILPDVGQLALATYAPSVSQASAAVASSGGFPDMPRRSGQKYKEWVRQQRIALGIVEPEPAAEPAPLEVSPRVVNELRAFRGLAKSYQAQIEQRQQADIGEKRMAREIARIQAQMDSARAHAEMLAAQIEEADVVYVMGVLAHA